MDDVRIIKSAKYMDDAIDCTNVRQESVPKTSALCSSLHKTRNIHDFKVLQGSGSESVLRIFSQAEHRQNNVHR